MSFRSKIIFSPFLFGLAHVHHFWERYRFDDSGNIKSILLTTIFQFTYTTIFGWLSCMIYLKNHNIFAASLAHMICNWMGFPDLNVFQSNHAHINPRLKFQIRISYFIGVLLFSFLLYSRFL